MYNVESETKQEIHGEKDGQTERHCFCSCHNSKSIWTFKLNHLVHFSIRSRRGTKKKNKERKKERKKKR